MRKTQVEILYDIMLEKNVGKWWLHHQLLDEFKKRVKTDVVSITTVLKFLVKDGCVIRAVAPNHLKRGKYYRTEYLYKATGKPYKPSKFADKIAEKNKFVNPDSLMQGRELYHMHRKLPRWFRRMMMD